MASLLRDGPATTAKLRFARRSWARVVLAVALLALTAGALATTAGATADPAACRAPAPRHAVVTNVRGMPCGEAVADLTGYRRAFAVSFRTPGGFTCARTFRNPRGERLPVRERPARLPLPREPGPCARPSASSAAASTGRSP